MKRQPSNNNNKRAEHKASGWTNQGHQAACTAAAAAEGEVVLPLEVLVKEEPPEDGWPEHVIVEVDVFLEAEEPTGWLLDEEDAAEVESEATEDVDVSVLTQADKANLLQPNWVARVRKLTQVRCDQDPEWSLLLLEAAAPRLEELHIQYVKRPHLQALLRMRKLWRLEVWHYCDDLRRDPYIFPPRTPRTASGGDQGAPGGPGGPGGAGGLEWVSCCLPLETTQSLLAAHRLTLRDVALFVGTSGDKGWPFHCNSLDEVLQGCGLPGPVLRLLLLYRDSRRRMHRSADCRTQRASLRPRFPGVNIYCTHCQGLIMSPGLPGNTDLTLYNLPTFD